MPTLDELGKFLNSVGFPGGFLLLCAAALWRAGVFLAPHIRDVSTAHIGLIKTLESNDTAKTRTLENVSTVLGEHSEILGEIHEAVKAKP